MAKAMAENEQTQKTFSKGQWFLFVVVIPILFALTVGLVLLSFAGVNVFEKAHAIGQQIPGISGMLSEEKASSEIKMEDVVALQGQIKERETQIQRMEAQMQNKDQSISELQSEIEQQQLLIDELRNVQEKSKREFKEVVSTFETMSAKSAAPILIEMDEYVALQVLSTINKDSLASILEKMPPEDAARFAQKLTVFIPNE
ncbi:hypothetical protein GCM10008967_23060 [Bacillus carboniphilus]|uniref:Magnesium transporter MgtE intracellular domain-containing protein n=1 Tax=Bacillus carboniphilus TaxID=86663 RepID=A0ABP3G191_9BACI